MGASNGRTKRSIERGEADRRRAVLDSMMKRRDTKGRQPTAGPARRSRDAQTSRMEAQAVELIRRAFASPYGRLYDDVPAPSGAGGRGFKEANVDREVLQRQNVSPSWPFLEDMTRDDWGDSESRSIRQYHPDHFETKRLAEDNRPPMSSTSPLNGRNYDPRDPQYTQRFGGRRFHDGWLREDQEGLAAHLVRLFGR